MYAAKDVFQQIHQKTFLVGNNFILLRLGEKCPQTPIFGASSRPLQVILIVHSVTPVISLACIRTIRADVLMTNKQTS